MSQSRKHKWQIVIKELSYDISAREPLLYFYTITFLRLRDLLVSGGSGGSGGASNGMPTTALGDNLGGLIGTPKPADGTPYPGEGPVTPYPGTS